MNVLCIGDVVGLEGLAFLSRRLPSLKRELGADICIVNGENSDKSGVGLTRHGAEEIFSHGADVITTGNHFLRRTSIDYYQEAPFVLAPANHPALALENGYCVLDLGKYSVTVVCLCGLAFLEPLNSPFDTLEKILEKTSSRFCIVDFHAESTAEKRAMGFAFDGKISAMFGTHTHVPTADACILPAGSGYITDVGMCGPAISVIGVAPSLAIEKQRYHVPVKFQPAAGPCTLNGVLFTLDDKTGLCSSVRSVLETED